MTGEGAPGGQGGGGDSCTETECEWTTDSETDQARDAGDKTGDSDTASDCTTNSEEDNQAYSTSDTFLASAEKAALGATNISDWTEGEIVKEDRNQSFHKVVQIQVRTLCTTYDFQLSQTFCKEMEGPEKLELVDLQ